MDILRSGLNILSGGDNSGKVEGKDLLGGIFSKILETVGVKNPEIANEANEARENAEKDRTNIFREVGKSLFLRQFPRLAAITDISKQLAGNKSAEQVSWQNEFETVSAFLLLIPGKWKHFITDFFANSNIFRTLVEKWPGLDGVDIPLIGKYLPAGIGTGSNIRRRVLNEKDPNAVIAALRVMHQDLFVTGKVSFDQVKGILAGNGLGAAASLLGGVAALTAGANALEGGSNTPSNSPTTGPASGPAGEPKTVEAVQAAATGTGPLKNKKLLDLQKQHPEKETTAMQTKLLELLKKLNVLDSAVLINGEWFDNNDEVTVGYLFENSVYFLTYDEDIASADISVRNSQGVTIYKETDYFSFNAATNAKSITAAMRKDPSETPSTSASASDNTATTSS